MPQRHRYFLLALAFLAWNAAWGQEPPAAALHAQVERAAGCHINSVSIGVPADKRTWRVDYDQACTTQQKASGDTVVAAFDYNSAANAPTDLAQKISAGISVVSTAASSLNATYALDSITLDQIKGVANDAASGLGLPGGGSTFTYPDISGSPHDFTATQIQNIYKAMRDLLLQLNTQAAIEAAGGQPNWPAQTATIP